MVAVEGRALSGSDPENHVADPGDGPVNRRDSIFAARAY